METLLETLKKYYYWIVFAFLEVFSITLLIQNNNYQGGVWCTAANNMAGTVNGWYAEATAYIHLKEVNTTLTQQNLYLQKQVADLREQLQRNESTLGVNDQEILDSLKHYKLIPARIISSSLTKDNNYLVINKGTADGVRTDMGVVGGGGIIGIVYLTGENYSLILPVINVKSNISCRVRHSNYFGYMQWAGGNIYKAYMTDIPHYAKIKVGQYIETSGYSSVFPPGLFVGRITSITNAADGLSMQLNINLGTDFANLTDVNVIYNTDKPKIDHLRSDFEQFENSEK